MYLTVGLLKEYRNDKKKKRKKLANICRRHINIGKSNCNLNEIP